MIYDSFNHENSLIEDDNQRNDNSSIKEIHIRKPLSSKLIVELLDTYPNLKRITCPISLYNRISKKYIDVLNEIGVHIKIKYNYNHPKKYGDDIGLKVVDLIHEGKTPLEVGNILDLPIKKVYYLRAKFSNPKNKLKTGKKTKYSEEQINSIKIQKEDGIPIKKIAEIENIPLRTVYYIIKNYMD
ncbi:MAG: helix-turn-helix domain-containing protein [Methanobrevibacter sp.]|jgi:hypothetical protein|nr:helix-turn-helix domain-containing protein [Methanobrevibacter sp.]